MSKYTIDFLLKNGKILSSDGNKSWNSTIFPESMRENISNLKYDKDNIITFIDDSYYTNNNIIILPKYESTILTENGKKIIKSTKFGDYDNSVKRYNTLNIPLSYNKDNNAFNFLNMKKPISNLLDVSDKELIFKPSDDLILTTKKNQREEQLFGTNFSHPHINNPKIIGTFKNNNKLIITGIFEWIVNNNIKYVYSINEHRPHIISDNYVTNLVYYTVTGSK